MKPVMYCFLDTPAGLAESASNTKSAAETVRSTRELMMKGVNFWELRKKAKKALNPNWDAVRSVTVETGRYCRPTAYE